MFDEAQLKEACLDFLRNRNSFAYSNYIQGIAFFLANKNNAEIAGRLNLDLDSINLTIRNKTERELIQLNLFNKNSLEELLWHFINAGIVVKSFNSEKLGDPQIDIFHVTPWGLKVLRDNKPSPYDQQDFLKDIFDVINEFDKNTYFYLDQSLMCFSKFLYIPSAIMLGIAAENIIQEISKLAEKKTANKEGYKKILKEQRYSISGHMKAIELILIKNIKKKMPEPLQKNLEKEFDCFFEIIRLSRNEAGHPSEIRIDRDGAYGNFIIFRKFCKKAFKLKKWLGQQEAI